MNIRRIFTSDLKNRPVPRINLHAAQVGEENSLGLLAGKIKNEWRHLKKKK